MTLRWLLFSALLATLVSAETVIPPVSRTLTDEFERTIEARIVGVTSDSVEIIRDADKARFSLSLQKLSAADRDFAAALLKKITESRPLPETPLISAVRRDFTKFDPVKKRLVPLDANAYAGARIFVFAYQHLYDPGYAFGGRASDKNAIPDQAPVLWVMLSGEPTLFELVGEKIPAGHAMISCKARDLALEQGREIQTDFISSWYKRNRQDTLGSQPFKPSDKERADFLLKLGRTMPPYWTEFAGSFDTGDNSPRSYPRFVALRRDGSPVKFRGSDLAGSFKVVMTVLRDNATELE